MALTEAEALSVLDFDQAVFNIHALDTLVRYLYEGIPGSAEQKQAERILTQFQGHDQAWTRVHFILENASSSNTKVCALYLTPPLRRAHQAACLQYFALNVLQAVIKTQWKLLPAEQAEGSAAQRSRACWRVPRRPPQVALSLFFWGGGASGIKNFIVETIIRLSSDFATLDASRSTAAVPRARWPGSPAGLPACRPACLCLQKEKVLLNKLNGVLVQVAKAFLPLAWLACLRRRSAWPTCSWGGTPCVHLRTLCRW
jgi:hypothetical protein